MIKDSSKRKKIILHCISYFILQYVMSGTGLNLKCCRPVNKNNLISKYILMFRIIKYACFC